MNITQRIGMAALVLLTVMLISCGERETALVSEDAIRGAGATFPAPLYEKWIEEYQKEEPDVEFVYDAVGSGEGIKRFIAETVDFGASDAAMRDSEIAQVKRGVRLVPGTAGMVVLAYNLPGVDGVLKLPRDVYVDIFAGKIQQWDDPRLRAVNPELTLPNKTIAVVVRQDSSGTTYAFTNHLSAISEDWRDRGPGVGKLIDWPGGAMTARGNEGVASRINVSEGAIGYVEYGFAKRLGLPMAQLENQMGQFVEPNGRTGQNALLEGSENMPQNLRFFIPDPQGQDAYPIVTYSWLLLYDDYANSDRKSALKNFLFWGLEAGQKFSEELGYIPLPREIVSRGQAILDRVHD